MNGLLLAPNSSLSIHLSPSPLSLPKSRLQALGTPTALTGPPPKNLFLTPESIFHRQPARAFYEQPSVLATLASLVFGHWFISASSLSQATCPTHSSFPEKPPSFPLQIHCSTPPPPQWPSASFSPGSLHLSSREPITLCNDIYFLMTHLTSVSPGALPPHPGRLDPVCSPS